MTLPVLTALTSKISSIFIVKYGYKVIFLIGFILMLAGVLGLLSDSFTAIYALMCLSSFGIGCGLFQPSNTGMLFKASEKSYQRMSNSLSRLFVNIGIALGSSLIAMYYAHNLI